MDKPIRVLIVEDSEDDTQLIVRELKQKGYEVTYERVDTSEAMGAALDQQKWDVILSDHSMPQFSSIKALEIMKRKGLDLPFIIISGSIGEETAVQTMKAGVHDYIMKDNLARLVPAIERELHEAAVRQERKRAWEALLESEKRYRQVVENAIEIIYSVDAKGNFSYANPAGLKVTGYSLAELRSLNYADIVVPDHRERLVNIYIHQLRERLPTTYVEFPFFGKTGEIIWFGQNSTLVTENEKVIGFHIIARDITDRKRAEQALLDSEERYRNLVENAPDVIFTLAIDGTIASLNPVFETITEWSCAEWLGKPFTTILRPDDLSQGLKFFESVFKGEKAAPFELRVLRKSGDYLTAEFTVTPQTQGGSVIGVLGIARDITERKRAEESLQKREQEIRVIAENVPALFSYVDVEGRYRFANKRYEEWFGIPRTEIIGKHCRQVLGEATYDLIKGRMEEALSGNRVHYEEVLPYASGGTRLVSADYVPDADNGGRVKGFFVLVTDITERKRAEEEMAALQEQLRQSQKMEAIGQLAGGVAHDFNNLLTIIKGYSQLSLMELRDEDPLKENLKEVGKAAEQAARLTRQILAFSRRQMMEMNVLDLNTILKDLDKMLRRVIGEDVELVTLLAEDVGRVRTDSGQIEQVIMNLAINARDAMPHGGKLTMETANVELDEEYARNHIAVKPGQYVMLAVSDTGVGMAPEVRDRIFEPFFTTKEKSKGTGLGLSTVYGIVKQSGGNIWVYSEPNHGTTFKIYLPRANEPLEELKEEVVKEGIHRGGETILLVEDEAEVRKLAARILKKQGYTVLEARDGEEALLLCQHKKEPVHLILTDVVMPQMGGPQLLEQLRQVRQDFKVLYMSGYTDNGITHRGVLEKGMNYIQKPFTVDGLARRVREVLDK